jgi:cytochrome c-type biogenesis protein CcmH
MRRTRRWALWLALGVVAVAALVVGVHRTSHPTVDEQTRHIASLVRCPVCEGQSAAQSDAPASVQIRNQIDQELITGESQGKILSDLVSAYGAGILEKPEATGVGLVVWVVPVVAVVLAMAGLVLAFSRWRPRQPRQVSDADRELVDRALHDPTAGQHADESPDG